MSQSLAAVLTVLVNSVLPFWFALGIVVLVIRRFRIPVGHYQLGLLSIPFMKILFRPLPRLHFFSPKLPPASLDESIG